MKLQVFSFLFLGACASLNQVDKTTIALSDVESVGLGASTLEVKNTLGEPSDVSLANDRSDQVIWIYEEMKPSRISTTLYFSKDGRLLAKIFDLPYSSHFKIQDIETRYRVSLASVLPRNCLAHSVKVDSRRYRTKTGELSAGIDEQGTVTTLMWTSPSWRSTAADNRCASN